MSAKKAVELERECMGLMLLEDALSVEDQLITSVLQPPRGDFPSEPWTGHEERPIIRTQIFDVFGRKRRPASGP